MTDELDPKRPVYGKKRVQVPVQLWMDPRILKGLDEIARLSRSTRTDVLRNALYTAVYAVLRDGLELREGPRQPHAELYDAIPQLRVRVGGTLVTVDEFGLEVPDEDTLGIITERAKNPR